MKWPRSLLTAGVLLALFSIASSSQSTEHNENDLCTDDAHCLNGGRCQEANSVAPHRHCDCADGFSGPACERFCPMECQNGGICQVAPTGGAEGLLHEGRIYNPDDYTCKCYGHFTGSYCELPYTQCGKFKKCYNGGKCMAGDDLKHHCKCRYGFSGDSCETKAKLIDLSDATTVTTLVVLVVVLLVALVVLLRRKRKRPIPDFVKVQEEAMKKHLNRMPHVSFDDDISLYDDELSHVQVGPFGSDSKLTAIT
eukprot:scaffold5067_cov139-Cylindrotheca_fusiformis.AAC.4